MKGYFCLIIFYVVSERSVESFAVLRLKPDPLLAVLNYSMQTTITSGDLYQNISSHATTCKVTCFVQPSCTFAVSNIKGDSKNCHLGICNKDTVYRLFPAPDSVVMLNHFGLDIVNVSTVNSLMFLNLEDIFVDVPLPTNLYYSAKKPKNIYWIINKPMNRAEAIGNCSMFPESLLANFSGQIALEVGIFVVTNENTSNKLQLNQYDSLPTCHISIYELSNTLIDTKGSSKYFVPVIKPIIPSLNPSGLLNFYPTFTYSNVIGAALCRTRIFDF